MTRDFRGAATCQWEYSSLELFAFSWSWTPAPNGFLSCQRQVLFHFCRDRRRHLHLCKENFIVQKKERIPTETEILSKHHVKTKEGQRVQTVMDFHLTSKV